MAADEIESHTLEVEGPRASSDRPLELSTESSFFLPSLNLSLSLSYFIGTRTRSDEGQKKNERKKEKGKGGENNTWPVFQTVVPYRHSFYQRKIVNNSFFIGLFRLGGTKLTVPSGFTGFYWVLLGFHEF